MAWLSRRPPPGRIFLQTAHGRSLRREIPAPVLDALLQRILLRGGAPAAKDWERTGQCGDAAVRAAWPPGVAPPQSALLCRGEPGRTGIWLEAVFAAEIPLPELAEDLERALAGAAPLPRVQAEPEAARRAEPAAPVWLPARPAPEPPSQPPVRPPAPSLALAPVRAAEPFLLADPGAGVWLDTGVEVRPADLPGLDPGDRLISPRRGPCVVAALNPGPGRILLRDARGSLIEVSHAELTGEFSFDDAEDEVRRG